MQVIRMIDQHIGPVQPRIVRIVWRHVGVQMHRLRHVLGEQFW
jgi:hypothetical protein